MKRLHTILLTVVITIIIHNIVDAQNLRFSGLVSPTPGSDITVKVQTDFVLILKNDNNITFTTSDTVYYYASTGQFPPLPKGGSDGAHMLQNELAPGDSQEVTLQFTFPENLANDTITLGFFIKWSKNSDPNKFCGISANYDMIEFISVPGIESDFNKIFYNDGNLYVDLKNKSASRIIITNIAGKTVKAMDINGLGQGNEILDVSYLPKGFYILNLVTADVIRTEKFVIW